MKLSQVKAKTPKPYVTNGWRDDTRVVKVYKRLMRRAEVAEEEFATIKDYVLGVQRKRIKYGKLTHSDVASRGQQRLVESLAQDKSHRSNIVDKQLLVLDSTEYIKTALSLIRRYIKTNYGPALKKEFGAITNQNEGIEDYFAKAVRVSKMGDSLSKMIDIVIADIDKGHFTDKALQVSAGLIFHPGRAD